MNLSLTSASFDSNVKLSHFRRLWRIFRLLSIFKDSEDHVYAQSEYKRLTISGLTFYNE